MRYFKLNFCNISLVNFTKEGVNQGKPPNVIQIPAQTSNSPIIINSNLLQNARPQIITQPITITQPQIRKNRALITPQFHKKSKIPDSDEKIKQEVREDQGLKGNLGLNLHAVGI